MPKRWTRLESLLDEGAFKYDPESLDSMFEAIRSRYPLPTIEDLPNGRLRIDGFPVNRAVFVRRVGYSLESRCDVSSSAWLKACKDVGHKMAAKAARQTRKRVEKTVRMGYESALVMGTVAPAVFYQSREWRRLRLKALEIHGSRCLCCGASPQTGAELHVDHVRPRSTYPELALDIENLQVLCKECNLGKGADGEQDWRPAAHESVSAQGVS